jgi:hypothetical protein
MPALNVQNERTNWTSVTILLLHRVEWQTKVYTQQLPGVGARLIFDLDNSQKISEAFLSQSTYSVWEKFSHGLWKVPMVTVVKMVMNIQIP